MSSKLKNYIENKKKIVTETKSPLTSEDLIAIFQKIKAGKDGKTYSIKEIKEIVAPLIPKVKDGHTPTKEEILKLIAPLIPKVKDGERGLPGKDAVVDYDFILSKIPKVKDGKPGKDAIMPDLRELAISAINVLEMFEGEDRLDVKAIKGIEKLIKKIISEEWLQYYTGPGNGPTTQTYGTGGFTYINEIVSGSGTTFTLAHVPQNGANVVIFGGGSRLTYGVDYTITGAIISMANAYSAGQVVADYS